MFCVHIYHGIYSCGIYSYAYNLCKINALNVMITTTTTATTTNNNNTLYLSKVTGFTHSNFRQGPVEMRLMATTALAYSYRRVRGFF